MEPTAIGVRVRILVSGRQTILRSNKVTKTFFEKLNIIKQLKITEVKTIRRYQNNIWY